MNTICVNVLIQSFSSTCFEHPSVHPQEDFYVQFYGLFHIEIIIKGHKNICIYIVFYCIIELNH